MYARRFRSLLPTLIALGMSTPGLAQDGDALIVTTLPITHSIATALTAETGIAVTNIPERGRRLNLLVNLFEQRGDRYVDTLAQATAVITIAKLWPDDPLYTAARQANIRVVDIDATKPWSTSLEGISVAFEPVDDVPWVSAEQDAPRTPSVNFWLSPTNAARAAEIVARDLARIFPDAAERIERNLGKYRNELLDLKRDYDTKLASVVDVTVMALAADFVYLTNDFGLFVDGYFLKQDRDWTDDDLAAFTAYLTERDIGTVLHKWEPEAPILAAIEAAGAELVVLDPIDAGPVVDGVLIPDGYQRQLEANLEAVYSALR